MHETLEQQLAAVLLSTVLFHTEASMCFLPRFPKTKTIHDHDYIARLLRFELEKVGYVTARGHAGRTACRMCYVHPCSSMVVLLLY